MSTSISKNFYDISKIPKDWTEKRLKNILSISEKKSSNFNDEKILSLTRKGIVVNDISINKGQIAESYEKYIKVKKGQICMNPMDLLSGWVDISSFDGLISPAYYTFELNEVVDNRFMNYFLQSNYLRKTFFKLGKGVASHDNLGRWVLTPEELKNIIIFIPNIEKQKIISSYLDNKIKLINLLIKKNQTKVELLKEQRISLINQCVTKGLDPNVETKDSGIEFIGNIPKKWNKICIKYLVSTKVTDGPHETPTFVEQGIPFLSVEGIVGNKINFTKIRGFITKETHEIYSKKCKPQKFDILLVKSGSTTGKSSIVETDLDFNIWSPLCILRSDTKKIDPYFFFNAIQSHYFRTQVEIGWSYGTQPNIGMGVIENLFIVVPPIDEQVLINTHLKKLLFDFDKKIENYSKRIEFYKEYSLSLISSCISGKIKVTKDML
ncbi:restriction endonuclease subunit S [Candidatus Pelagibacter communis]|uniref:restriction endonuclease subunit S n=1 Tax=Pelagibacter ubique TaxID=198252 RepID=UPI00092CF51F|nr:restriction endonuclease subunit S [Candidatus Pelagibacter ubique]